ncbi:MAG TPA: ATP-binding protein [Gammaproteobacteria bacterium]|nr:ATP-binding protein [Gammaproteobacteria bacterium]
MGRPGTRLEPSGTLSPHGKIRHRQAVKLRHSLEGKFASLAGILVIVAALVSALLYRVLGSFATSVIISLTVMAPIIVYAIRRFMQPIRYLLTALGDGVSSFKDGDFSISLNATRQDELGELARQYNQVGEILRQERYNLYQRELLLDTVIQNTPWALLLINASGRVIYSNVAARRLFNAGRKLEGHAFAALLERVPDAMRQAVARDNGGMFSVRGEEEEEIYYLSREHFTLNAQPHHLYLFKQLTRELNRQEVAVWKKVIRVISHELNNSLAPISSLAHSGHILSEQADSAKLKNVFGNIEERTTHLKKFIDGYARFAKLPSPQIVSVEWTGFFASLRALMPFTLQDSLPGQPARFDPAQLQQALINLLKNARESGSSEDAIMLSVHQDAGNVRLDISDAGPGMSPEILEQSLLPFYSTKQSGSGLGLPLCREIVEAHGGRISLANRAQGGLTVSIWLPMHPDPNIA